MDAGICGGVVDGAAAECDVDDDGDDDVDGNTDDDDVDSAGWNVVTDDDGTADDDAVWDVVNVSVGGTGRVGAVLQGLVMG